MFRNSGITVLKQALKLLIIGNVIKHHKVYVVSPVITMNEMVRSLN